MLPSRRAGAGREGAAGGYRGAGDDWRRRLLRSAILYARRGIPVFACELGGKRPLTANGLWEATTDEREVFRVNARPALGNLAEMADFLEKADRAGVAGRIAAGGGPSPA